MDEKIKEEKMKAIEAILVGLSYGQAQYILDLISQNLQERAILQS
jgi:hypothetical protein